MGPQRTRRHRQHRRPRPTTHRRRHLHVTAQRPSPSHGLDDKAAAAAHAAAHPAAHAAAHPDADLPAPLIRTPDQRRADALIALPHATTGQPPKVVTCVNISVALSTLIGLDDQPGDITAPGLPPATASTATQARLHAHHPNSSWRRLITDPIGKLIDYGRSTYRPPAALADHIRARDRHCVAPHCHRNTAHCDIDHHHDWALGGTTSEDNLGDICPRDHQAKHNAGWTIARLHDGTTRWTSPTARTYDRPPATYPIDHTTNTHTTHPKTRTRATAVLINAVPMGAS